MTCLKSAVTFCHRHLPRISVKHDLLVDAVRMKRHNTSVSEKTVGKLELIFAHSLGLRPTFESIRNTVSQIRQCQTTINAMPDGKARRSLDSMMIAMGNRVDEAAQQRKEDVEWTQRLTRVVTAMRTSPL